MKRGRQENVREGRQVHGQDLCHGVVTDDQSLGRERLLKAGPRMRNAAQARFICAFKFGISISACHTPLPMSLP